MICTILVVSLIVIDVHARDVVERLINKEISSLHDFEWISTMRYYLTKSVEDPNEPTVNIEMISTTIEYGFEYLGNTSRLVVTPLTERCYRTLMGALKMNLGGAPEVSNFFGYERIWVLVYFSCDLSEAEYRIRDHSFKTSACLRGGGVSPCADGPKVTVHKYKKSPS